MLALNDALSGIRIPSTNNTGSVTKRRSLQHNDLMKMGDDNEEDDNAYRRRVYGKIVDDPDSSLLPSRRGRSKDTIESGSFRKFSKRMSQSLIRRSSSVKESLPDTPAGWSLLLCATMSAVLAYEVRLQNSLTHPPVTFCQLGEGGFIERIYRKLRTEVPDIDENNNGTSNILSRSIQPSLFVGTRGLMSSTMAYLKGGPSSASKKKYVRFREIFDMPQDGARIAVDWEYTQNLKDEDEVSQSGIEWKRQKLRHPVVIILHGINNDSSFGYMKSLSRAFCNQGYISASMNFRGCGGLKLTTPRGYNAAYTGDLRSLVRQISVRLEKDVPIFLVGSSLGANIMTKYLGEECMMGTLPSCVSGAAGLGNPLRIDSTTVKFPFNVLLALGIKKIFLENIKSIYGMKDSYSKQKIRQALLAPTIGEFDDVAAPISIRNDTHYPFGIKIGYDNGAAYGFDASSYRYIRHISVPFLNLTAQDDFIAGKPSRNKLGFCLSNPNVMHVETQCGGHLGWQENTPGNTFGASSWADVAVSDFFHAIMAVKKESFEKLTRETNPITESKFDYPEPPVKFNREMEKSLMQAKINAMALTTKHLSKL